MTFWLLQQNADLRENVDGKDDHTWGGAQRHYWECEGKDSGGLTGYAGWLIFRKYTVENWGIEK